MLDPDTVFPGVEGDDADADAEAKVDSSTRQESPTASDTREVDSSEGGSDGSPDSKRRGSRAAPPRLASTLAARGPGTHSRGGLGGGGTEGGGG